MSKTKIRSSRLIAVFVYSEIQIQLLPPHYETKCQVYETHDEYNRLNSRSHCITDCILKLMKQNCYHNLLNLNYSLPTLTEQYLNNNKEYICQNLDEYDECSKKILFKIYTSCEESCPRNCFERLFDISFDHYFMDLQYSSSISTTIIRHRNGPDHIIIHMPEMDFIKFISNLGGLLGMWLGMSILFTFDYILSLI